MKKKPSELVREFCKENGICTNCQLQWALPDNNMCDPCRIKNYKYVQKSRRKRAKGPYQS